MRYKECKEYIRSDYFRITGRMNDGLLVMWFRAYWECGFHFLFWWRLSKMDGIKALIPRLISRHLGKKYHISIERNTDIGYGFWLVHGGPVVVNCFAKIGDNCQMYQYSTIGSSSTKAAVIGDNVYIGPSVCIVGDIVIGNEVTIGAGSVVVKDIPSGSTYAGNPANEISRKEPGRLIVNRWSI